MMMKKYLLGLTVVLVLWMFQVEEMRAQSLKDIPDAYRYEIELLMEHDIVNGYEDNTFRPKKAVTRAEAITMIGKVSGLDVTKEAKVPFADVSDQSFARAYIAAGVEAGILNGYPDGTFGPAKPLTRGDMAVVLSKAFHFTETTNTPFTDIKTEDYYYTNIQQIFEAGVTSGYPDGTYRPKQEINRAEFSAMLARILKEQLKEEAEKEEAEKEEVETDEPTDEENLVTEDQLEAEGVRKYVDVETKLNVRQGPGQEYSVIGQLEPNQEIKVYETSDTWWLMTTGNLTGYVHRDYLADESITLPLYQTVMLDAGHGGKDPGASGNGIIEKELVLDVTLRAKALLEEAGIDVLLTRSDDTFISLEGRVEQANRANLDAFVSVHANNYSDAAVSGTESFVRTANLFHVDDRSAKLAESIQKRLLQTLGTKDRGVKQANFYVVRFNRHPATLLELGFMSNKREAEKLDTRRQDMAIAIKDGILDYYDYLYSKNNVEVIE